MTMTVMEVVEFSMDVVATMTMMIVVVMVPVVLMLTAKFAMMSPASLLI